MNLQDPSNELSIKSFQIKPNDLKIKGSIRESFMKIPQNYEKSSEMDLITEAWKHKFTIWKYVSNYQLFAFAVSSFAALTTFIFKSKAFRRFMVKRYLISNKNMSLSATTNLCFIPRPTIFKNWDKIVSNEASSQPIVLIEGYQGTGKSFLVQKYIEEQSKIRPTLYINLRDINLEEWKQVIGYQINFYPEMFLRSKGIN